MRANTRVLVVEDVVTTGGSVKKTVAHLEERGATVAGVGILVDRSGGKVSFDCQYVPLARISLDSWDPATCDLCKRKEPLVNPDDLVG